MPTGLVESFGLEERIEELDLTPLHRIILRLSSRDLETEIQEHPESLDARDAMGRTAFWWATELGDVAASERLLSYDVDPSIADYERKLLFTTPCTKAPCI